MLEKQFKQTQKIAKPYTVSDFGMGISLAISVGSCPFSKIDSELFEVRC